MHTHAHLYITIQSVLWLISTLAVYHDYLALHSHW